MDYDSNNLIERSIINTLNRMQERKDDFGMILSWLKSNKEHWKKMNNPIAVQFTSEVMVAFINTELAMQRMKRIK